MLKLYQQSRGVKVGSNVYAWDVPKCELGDENLTEISFAVYCGLGKVKAGGTNEAPVELGVGKRWFPWGTKKRLSAGKLPSPTGVCFCWRDQEECHCSEFTNPILFAWERVYNPSCEKSAHAMVGAGKKSIDLSRWGT